MEDLLLNISAGERNYLLMVIRSEVEMSRANIGKHVQFLRLEDSVEYGKITKSQGALIVSMLDAHGNHPDKTAILTVVNGLLGENK